MSWSRRYEEGAPQRVNRWLAQNGVCSRREADALIAQGLVFIDGVRVEHLGRKIEPGQVLSLAPASGRPARAPFTAVLNKPVGFVSGQPAPGQRPAARLLTRSNLMGESALVPDRSMSLAPLGRLDKDSRGLLILSEDGVLARAVIAPSSALDKEYRVEVAGAVTAEKLALLRHGMQLDGRALKPAHVAPIKAQVLSFILTEGRNRQIRRMCAQVGLAVTDLQRVRIGPLRLRDLPEGRWRALTDAERARLAPSSSGVR